MTKVIFVLIAALSFNVFAAEKMDRKPASNFFDALSSLSDFSETVNKSKACLVVVGKSSNYEARLTTTCDGITVALNASEFTNTRGQKFDFYEMQSGMMALFAHYKYRAVGILRTNSESETLMYFSK